MMKLTHKFVTIIPEEIEDGILYISMEYATAIHNCCSGCGKQVVTPFSPTDWKLVFDGETVSLDPSIGNWNFECQSHYWIRNNQVIWAPSWTKEQIAYNRSYDKNNKQRHYNKNKSMDFLNWLLKRK